MIEYRFPEEKEILLHYARNMRDSSAERIIINGGVENDLEAEALTSFYWSMVDRAIEDGGVGISAIESEGVEPWMEYIFHSLNGYMVSNGYTAQWDKE